MNATAQQTTAPHATGVRVERLAIDRGGWRLFENLSFSAAPGAHVALIGPNGAGKTSLLRAIAGFLRPSEGSIAVHTITTNAATNAARDGEDPAIRIHFLGHRDGLKATLDARAHVRHWAALLDGDEASDVIARLGLERVADLPARTLSAGQGRRLALARLLVAARPVWLLDEPAAALDASAKALLNSLIDTHRAGGGVVIAAVHEPLGAPSQTIELGA